MSRHRSRKLHARRFERDDGYAWGPMLQDAPPAPPNDEPREPDYWAAPALFDERVRVPLVTACGKCREFVEGTDWGRGTCIHPASGVLSPWPDTPGCDYYRARR